MAGSQAVVSQGHRFGTARLAPARLATTWLAAAGRPAGADTRREPDRPGERAARQILDHPIQLVADGAVQDRAGQHGRQEGSRQQGPSQFFYRDRQFGRLLVDEALIKPLR